MKISATVFLAFFLVFLCNTAVIEDTNGNATEKKAPTPSPTIPASPLIFVPNFNLEPYFSIGPGFRLPYLQTLASYYYSPWQTYYVQPTTTYWVGKKTTLVQGKKNEPDTKNQENMSEKGEKPLNIANPQKDTQTGKDKQLLDLGKNTSTDNNNQKVKQNNGKSEEPTNPPAEKSQVNETSKISAEKNLRSQPPSVESVAPVKTTEKGPEDSTSQKEKSTIQNAQQKSPADTPTEPAPPKDAGAHQITHSESSSSTTEAPKSQPHKEEGSPASKDSTSQTPAPIITGLTFKGENSSDGVQLPKITVEP